MSTTLMDSPETLAPRVASELRPTLWMALPVVVSELGWMAMGVVDTLMVGRLGPEAIGAAGVGSSIQMAVVVFGYGLMLGLDSIIPRAFGKGDLAECHRAMIQGMYMALILSPILMGIIWWAGDALPSWGIQPEVVKLARPYLTAMNWSTPSLLVYTVLRRYVVGMSRVRIVTLTLAAANLLNVFGNYALIHGSFGMPALGLTGSGWSTCLARLGMTAVLVGHVVWYDRAMKTGLWRVSFLPDLGRLKRFLRLGLPSAAHVVLEAGVFAAATMLAGRFAATSLAAHQIVLECASVTFMVPYGVSSVGAVRVGQALGRGEVDRAARAGWAALVIGEGFMLMAALGFILTPRTLLSAFTTNPDVTAAGVGLFAIAACFQLFDGLQVVATGIMRGAGDTHTTMYINLVAYWVIGLPLGALLAFRFGLGVHGLWVGLSVGLMLAGGVLLAAWRRKARSLRHLTH